MATRKADAPRTQTVIIDGSVQSTVITPQPDDQFADPQVLTTAELAAAVASSTHRTATTPPAPIDNRTSTPARYPLPGEPVVRAGVGDARFHPSPAVDERVITSIAGYEEFAGDFAAALTAMSEAHLGLREIDTARQKAEKNQSFTPASRLTLVAQFAAKKRDAWHTAIDREHTRLSERANALEASLNAPMEASAAGTLATEIRAHVKLLPTSDRSTFLAEAMQRGDVKSLAAVLGAPAYLSGLEPAMVQHYTRLYREATAPVAVRKLAVTRKVMAVLERAAPIAYAQVEDAMGGTFESAARYKKADDEAHAALKIVTRGVG